MTTKNLSFPSIATIGATALAATIMFQAALTQTFKTGNPPRPLA